MKVAHPSDTAPDGKTNSGKLLVRSGLFLLSMLVALLIAEAGLRTQVWLANRDTLDSINAEDSLPPGTVVTLKSLVRPVQNDDLIYELQPNISGLVFEGASVSTNRRGFRGPEVELEKQPNTIRIVGIGDSVMFGQGVEESDCYLTILSQQLNSSFPERNWEIINTAVPGYNTVMEVETLITKGLAYEPDLVILGVVGNDLDLPNFLYNRVDAWNFGKSFLADFISRAFDSSTANEASGLIDTPNRDGDKSVFENDPSKVPARYVHMVGMDAVMRSALSLAQLRDSNQFEVMSCTYWEDPSVTEKPAFAFMANQRLAELGFRPIDQGQFLDEFMKRNELGDYDKTEFVVSATDAHPSPVHHQLIAEAFFQSMVAEGLIETLMQ